MGTVDANLRNILETSKFQEKNLQLMYDLHIHLHIHFQAIHLKYTHIAKLPDFVGVQQLHSSCAFVEVIFEGDAAVPGLDFTAASP